MKSLKHYEIVVRASVTAPLERIRNTNFSNKWVIHNCKCEKSIAVCNLDTVVPVDAYNIEQAFELAMHYAPGLNTFGCRVVLYVNNFLTKDRLSNQNMLCA